MRLAVVIPALNESESIGACVANARALADAVIVVDGGSTDDTAALAARSGALVLNEAAGRARQMNAGARAALREWDTHDARLGQNGQQSRQTRRESVGVGRAGDVLLFLHADSRLPNDARQRIELALRDGACWGRFDVRLDADPWLLRLVERMMNFRSRVTGICTGDQAIFMRRDVWDAVGGFPQIPLMEDVAVSRALRAIAPVTCLQGPVLTSARRWLARGPLRTIGAMWLYRALYFFGVSPWTLHRLYYGRPAPAPAAGTARGSGRCADT